MSTSSSSSSSLVHFNLLWIHCLLWFPVIFLSQLSATTSAASLTFFTDQVVQMYHSKNQVEKGERFPSSCRIPTTLVRGGSACVTFVENHPPTLQLSCKSGPLLPFDTSIMFSQSFSTFQLTCECDESRGMWVPNVFSHDEFDFQHSCSQHINETFVVFAQNESHEMTLLSDKSLQTCHWTNSKKLDVVFDEATRFQIIQFATPHPYKGM